MISVAELLDRARSRANIESDYRLADVLGISRAAVSSYRKGKSHPDDRVLSQLCALSGDDLDIVAAEIQSMRAQSPEGRAMWLGIAKRLAGGAQTAILSVLFAICLVAANPGDARAGGQTGAENQKFDFLYIV